MHDAHHTGMAKKKTTDEVRMAAVGYAFMSTKEAHDTDMASDPARTTVAVENNTGIM